MSHLLKFGTLPFFNMVMSPEADPSGGEGGGGGNPDPAPTGGDPDPAPSGGGGGGDGGGGGNPDPAPTGGDPDPKSGNDPDPANEPEGNWPDDWRERMAKDKDGNVDKKKLNILKRFNSPMDYSNSYFSLNHKIATGELKRPLSENATDEELAEYRKENGIPEKADGYLEGLDEGIVFGEEDQAVLTPFLEDMHKMNATPQMVHSALNSYQAAQAAQAEFMQEQDQQLAEATEDALRAEWGGDYRGNINAINAFIDTQFPADIKENLMNARLGDGTPLMHNQAMLESFASLGRIMNPQSTVTHARGMDNLSAMEDRIGEIEKMMGNKQSDYWKGSNSAKIQQEYRDLVTARDRMSSKG